MAVIILCPRNKTVKTVDAYRKHSEKTDQRSPVIEMGCPGYCGIKKLDNIDYNCVRQIKHHTAFRMLLTGAACDGEVNLESPAEDAT